MLPNGEKIAEFFVKSRLGREVINHPEIHEAFPNDCPKSFKLTQLEKSITTRSEVELNNMKIQLQFRCVAGEIDGGRKMRRDFTSLLLGGKFIETFLLDFTETKENMKKWLTSMIKKQEEFFQTTIVSMCNDNCVRIDSPMHTVCINMGIMHPRCIAHSFQLSLGDIHKIKDDSICSQIGTLMVKVNDSVKLIMNRKEPLQKFKEEQVAHGIKHPKILLRPSGTRWSCKSGSMIRFNELLEPIVITFTKLKMKSKDAKKVLKDDLKMLLDPEIMEFVKEFEEEKLQEELIFSEDEEPSFSEIGVWSISPEEQEQIFNYSNGFYSLINPYIALFQLHRYSLMEWIFHYKELKFQCIQIQNWNHKVCSTIKTEFHETAKEDLQALWMSFLKRIDARSSQFNDRLLCIGEHFVPFSIGLQFSFTDWREVFDDFLGFSEEPRSPEDKEGRLWGIGPIMLKKILDSNANNSPLSAPSLEDLQSQLREEHARYEDRGTWISNVNLGNKTHLCPLQYWNQLRLKFPNLSILATTVLTMEITISSTERSMKSLGSFVTEKRNRLGLQKVNEEMRIVFNSNTEKLNEERITRLNDVYNNFLKKYEDYKITVTEEKQWILALDAFPDPKKKTQVTQQSGKNSEQEQNREGDTNVVQQPQKTGMRKTKVYQIIAEDPDYLPKVRITRSGKNIQGMVHENSDSCDEDYE